MPYNRNIPNPNDIPLNSQSEFLQNFTELAEFAERDHVALGSVGSGFHRKTTYVNIPTPDGTNNAITMWSQEVFGNQQLLYRRNQSANATTLTGGFFRTTASVDFPSGYSNLPSGVILKWGRVTTDAQGRANVDTVFLPSPSFSEDNYLIQLTVHRRLQGNIEGNSLSAIVEEKTGEQFVILVKNQNNNPVENIDVDWLAIGNSFSAIIP